MNRVAVLLVLAAACGGSQNVGPVPGAHEAFERHYPVTIAQAHAALVQVVGHYELQVFAGVVGTDGDAQIQLGGYAKDFDDHVFAIGAPGSPAWMPHEVDLVRVAVDKELAAR